VNTIARLFARTAWLAAALMLLAALVPAPALSDERAAAANRLAVEQMIDVASTLTILHNGGAERDPFATPFTHSPLTQVAAAVGFNLMARRMPIHMLRTVINIYPVVLLGNVRSLSFRVDVAGQVPRSRH
jgi:hypothetical protein